MALGDSFPGTGPISTHPARRIEELLPDRWQALRQAAEAAKD